MAIKIDRPTCVHCGAKLCKNTTPASVMGESKPKVGDWLNAKDVCGDEAPGIITSVRGGYNNKFWVGVWRGRWGRNGDNRFCGNNCAQGWALAHCRTQPVPGLPERKP